MGENVNYSVQNAIKKLTKKGKNIARSLSYTTYKSGFQMNSSKNLIKFTTSKIWISVQ